MRLHPHEFIRRFLMHVLPKGFHRIRHYGLFANVMTQACSKGRDFPVSMRWLYTGSDLSRPDHGDQCAERPDALRALAEMPIAGSPPHMSTHPGRFRAVLRPPSSSALTSNPHSARCPAGAQLPATSCLGAFWTPVS
jgi:hypothetical protein